MRFTRIGRMWTALLVVSSSACAGRLAGDASVPDAAHRDAELADATPDATPDAPLDARVDAGPSDAAVDAAADASLDSSADAAVVFRYDLDGDGAPDTNLEVMACPAGLCLSVESDVTSTTSVALDASGVPGGPTTVTLIGRRLRLIGDHAGSALAEVSVFYAVDRGTHQGPALAVVDVDAASVIARATAPASLTAFAQYPLAGYTAAPRGPGGERYPLLAPSYGDSELATWGALCLFHPGAPGEGDCGAGFLRVSSVPAAGGWFREVGGYLQDLDGDGYEDITLIFHREVLAISGRDGSRLALTSYDVAASTEPGSPPWFHSGRNYGTHAAFTGADGKLRTLVVGGAPVGSFTDANCNVSRFVAVLETSAGVPSTRHLAWSDYFGFASSIFVRYDPAYATHPADDLARMGDFVDGCVHRFSDSRSVIDGAEAAIFDVFLADAPVSPCLEEQYQLYLPPTWTDEKAATWYACFGANVGSLGTWSMQARHVEDGTSVTGSTGTYVWGRSDALLPSGEIVYLVESVPAHARFDLMDVPPSALHVYALVAGLWTNRGVFPVAGRPRIAQVEAEDAHGVGSFTSLAELTLEDRDADGLMDVMLSDGSFVGYDGASMDFAVKP